MEFIFYEIQSQLSCTAVETGATAATEVSAPVSHRRGGVLGGKKAKAAKPSLPVKRSKSMKVYRGFDVRDLEAEPPHPGQIDASVPGLAALHISTCILPILRN